jgi:putative heme transporter
MVMTQAASAVTNTVPTVGPAIGVGLTYTMFRSWGYSGSRTSVAVLVSGVWNVFVKLGLPVLALALVLLQGGAGGGRVTLALAGIAALVAAIVVFALVLRSEQLAERFGLLAGRVASRLLGLVRRPPVQGWELATVKFRTRTLELLEHGWVPITAATLVSHLSAVCGAAGLSAGGRGQRRRGFLGPGAGGVCVHAPDYDRAVHPRQRGGGGAFADRAAGGCWW